MTDMITRHEYKAKVPTNAPRIENHSERTIPDAISGAAPKVATPKPDAISGAAPQFRMDTEVEVYDQRTPTNLPRFESPNIIEVALMDAAEFLDTIVDDLQEDLQDDINDAAYEEYRDDVIAYNEEVDAYNDAIIRERGAVPGPKRKVLGFDEAGNTFGPRRN
jgi:hypothetical protein